MNLHELKPAQGATKNSKKRLGRGQGTGKGGTSTRGHKGAKSRSGYSRKIGFEGGQMPLQRRVPKFGFNNINRVEYKAVNISKLQELFEAGKIADSKVTIDLLIQNGLASKNDLVKVLGKGELKAALSIAVHKFSKTAEAAILAAGGSIENI